MGGGGTWWVVGGGWDWRIRGGEGKGMGELRLNCLVVVVCVVVVGGRVVGSVAVLAL